MIKSDGQTALNGFDALADYDSNNDGMIDATDAQWSQLKIWKDANSNGISEANELFSLDSINGVGIKQINLANVDGGCRSKKDSQYGSIVDAVSAWSKTAARMAVQIA